MGFSGVCWDRTIAVVDGTVGADCCAVTGVE
jgi:hypothetical protein